MAAHSMRIVTLCQAMSWLSLAACTAGGTTEDLAEPIATDAAMQVDAVAQADAAERPDAAMAWSRYVIDPGMHAARVDLAPTNQPIRFLTTVRGRDYVLRLNASAAYVLTAPTEPNDQHDWNKLPGFSDCATVDLAQDGAMFGWRWRDDLSPAVLEVTAYANQAGVHRQSAVLTRLDLAELSSDAPLRYRVWIDGASYRFAIDGAVNGRAIAASASLPRACPTYAADGWKWASDLYFGGTSTAPSVVTAWVAEQAFVP